MLFEANKGKDVMLEKCRLCLNKESGLGAQIQGTSVFLCDKCGYLQKRSSCFLPNSGEKHRYAQHRNSLTETPYVNFIEPFCAWLRKSLVADGFGRVPSFGLDYGSGPGDGPLADYLMLKANKDGAELEILKYDPHFAGTGTTLGREEVLAAIKQRGLFDFIICHEVAEHFQDPYFEWRQMLAWLKPDGFLFLRTEPYPENAQKREAWGYFKDPTHYGFYGAKTLDCISRQYAMGEQKLLWFV